MPNSQTSFLPARQEDAPFSITVTASCHDIGLKLDGEVDEISVSCVESALAGCRDLDVSTVSIDLGDVTFMSSRVLGLLADAHVELGRRGCRVEITECSRVVHRLIALATAVGVLPDGLLEPSVSRSAVATRLAALPDGNR